MRIRKRQNSFKRSRRNFGFDQCGLSILCNSRCYCCRSWTYFWMRKVVVPLMILIGFGLTTTLITITPSQQLHYANWESSLISIPIKGAANSKVTNNPNFSDKSNTGSGTSGSSSYSYSGTQNLTVNPNIVIKWNHWKDMERIVDSIWGGSLFCKTIKQRIDQYYNESMAIQTANTGKHLRNLHSPLNTILIPNIYVHFEFSCHDLYKYSRHGTGNYIQAIYFMRLAVKFMPNVNMKLNITCIDNTIEFQSRYVLPRFTGVWYTPKPPTISRFMERIRILIHTQRYQSFIGAVQYENYCGCFKDNPTAILYREMQYDVRRMAIALVGTQPFINDDDSNRNRRRLVTKEIEKFMREHIHEQSLYESILQVDQNIIGSKVRPVVQNVSLKPGTRQEQINSKTTNIVPLIQLQQPNNNVIFDDAVIHFRCGDLLSTDLLAYGFLTFDGYSRHISSSVQSIGIFTQPFGQIQNSTSANMVTKLSSTVEEGGQRQTLISDQRRSLDTNNETISRRCRILVYAFQQYLQEKFPKAKVHIRNDRTETVALAYARMVMAKQVVGSMSTFSIYPIIGTFGTGYYLRPKVNDPSVWAVNKIYPVMNIWDLRTVIFDEEAKLLGTQAKDLWDAHGDDVVLQWFRTGAYAANATS